MNLSTQHYYLQQLGIVPWLKRSVKSNPCTVLVLAIKPSNQEAELLQRMLKSIELSDQEYRVLFIEPTQFPVEQIKQASQKVLLLVGDVSLQSASNLDFPGDVVCLPSPAELIQQPHLKKQAYRKLLQLKSLL